MKLTNRTILLTGGGNGIGRAIALELARRNNTVLICGRNLNTLDDTASASDNIYSYRCDISVSEDIEQLLAAAASDGHKIDTLINNAAISGHYTLAKDFDISIIRRDLGANLIGPIELTQRLLPILSQHHDPVIMMVNSPSCLLPVADIPFYSASKAGLHSYTWSLRKHLGKTMKVIEIFPPAVDTELVSKLKHKKMSVKTFIDQMFQQLDQGKNDIWIGESKIMRAAVALLPFKLIFNIINARRSDGGKWVEP